LHIVEPPRHHPTNGIDSFTRPVTSPVMSAAAALQIDGSLGEGGGQVLRSALTLSLFTGTPVRLTNIRAKRPKPGLMAQHLKAVEAAAAIGRAQVDGAVLGSQRLTFEPNGIHAGHFHFDIATAGSTTLVLQTILPPLGLARTASTIVITGGTHVPWSPSFDYLDLHWLRYMEEIGFHAAATLPRAGFYPRGGGRVEATVQPAAAPSPLRLTERGPLKGIHGISAVANLDRAIAERQRRQALRRLSGYSNQIDIEPRDLPAPSPGTFLLLLAEFDGSRCCYVALGARGKPAERVADEAVDALAEFLATDGAVDQFLADQLLVPLTLAAGISEIRTSKVTEHLVTNAKLACRFIPAAVSVAGDIGRPGVVRISGIGESSAGHR
jgi:RNA 3'-terminal phosphate cyclase (ATP)